MKQNITLEQLNNLSSTGKAKLTAWVYDKRDRKKREQVLDMCLSIGQMIELLNDFEAWESSIEDYPGNDYVMDSEYRVMVSLFPHDEDLCDSLWEAVKQVLENNDKKTTN